jgi:hypothetical protein
MDSDIDIDELDAFCASQGGEKKVEGVKDEEEEREEEERLKNEFVSLFVHPASVQPTNT